MSQFTLDTSTLGGSGFNYNEQILEDRGRSIQISWSQSGSDQDMELFGFSVRCAPGDPEAQEQS